MKSSKTNAVLLAGFLGFALGACSPMADNSLLSDKRDLASTLTVDKTPKSEEIYLKLDVTNVTQAVVGDRLELGGECYTSTYPDHRILAYAATSGGNVQSGNQLSLIDVSESVDASRPSQAFCRNGRFNFSLYLGTMATNYRFTVRVVLEAIDGTGALVTNNAQGTSSVSFTRAN